jgi:hypothetical protein
LVVVATWETSNRKLCKKKETTIKITRKNGLLSYYSPSPSPVFRWVCCRTKWNKKINLGKSRNQRGNERKTNKAHRPK